MKKNIEWLKSAIQQNLDFYNDNDEEWQMAKVRAYAKSLDLINQLDEPEVLSQELPVIPNYVAKWISIHHEQFDLYPALKRLENNALSWEDVYEWYRRNTYTFVNAYLTGKYEVEEEQKYYVLNKNNKLMLRKYTRGVRELDISNSMTIDSEFFEFERFALTEQEIKDYDERFWPFAVKVEELEE